MVQAKTALRDRARELRKQGIAITKIAKELGCAKASVSIWTRDILLTEEQKKNLLDKAILSSNMSGGTMTRISAFRQRRIECQNRGRNRIKSEDPLYLAGCMLYWGEGAKGKNQVKITNSSISMIVLFKTFIERFFEVNKDDFILTINCYTDIHSLEEIEAYWLNKLSLNRSNLRKGQVNNFPKSSKNIKSGKCEWGTAALIIHRTDIVQEIYGAIQEYASFDNLDWLDK
jgi:hypothetical protein